MVRPTSFDPLVPIAIVFGFAFRLMERRGAGKPAAIVGVALMVVVTVVFSRLVD